MDSAWIMAFGELKNITTEKICRKLGYLCHGLIFTILQKVFEFLFVEADGFIGKTLDLRSIKKE